MSFNVAAISNPLLSPDAMPSRTGGALRDSFAAALMQAQGAARSEQSQDEQTARASAQQLVASTFLLPLLQTARQDPFRTEMFHGGFGEDAFGAQLDTQLADRMASGPAFKGLVDAVYRQIARPSGHAAGHGEVKQHG